MIIYHSHCMSLQVCKFLQMSNTDEYFKVKVRLYIHKCKTFVHINFQLFCTRLLERWFKNALSIIPFSVMTRQFGPLTDRRTARQIPRNHNCCITDVNTLLEPFKNFINLIEYFNSLYSQNSQALILYLKECIIQSSFILISWLLLNYLI